jgi:hypothetical protein
MHVEEIAGMNACTELPHALCFFQQDEEQYGSVQKIAGWAAQVGSDHL